VSNPHFLAKLGEFFRSNKEAIEAGEMTPEEVAAAFKQARAHSGGKAKADARMMMSEEFSKTGDWKLFLEQKFAEPPVTIQVLPKPGTYSHPRYGKFKMTPENITAFVDNHNNHVYQEQVPIDAEHESKLSGAVGYYGEMRLIDQGRGGAEADVSWTDRGKQLLASDQFKYFSPEWFDEWTDPAGGKKVSNVLVGGAITTRPFFKDKVMRPLTASEDKYAAGEWVGDEENRMLFMEPMTFAETEPDANDPNEQDEPKEAADMTVKCPKCGKMSAADAPSCSGCGTVLPADAKKANLDTGDAHVDSLAHREFDKNQRNRDAASGAALPDGSFPIENKSDLSNAIHAYGRAGDKAKAKAHIISRAKSLGATSMLPDGWVGGSKVADEPVVVDKKEVDAVTKTYVEAETKQLTEKLETETGLRQAAEKRLASLEADAQTRRFSDVIMGRDAAGDGSPPFAGKHEMHNSTLALLAKEFGEDSDQFKEYISEQRAVSKQMREAGLFKELGKGSGPDQVNANDGATRRFNDAVAKWQTDNPTKSKVDAITAIAQSQPKLYTESIREKDRIAKTASTRYGYEEEGE